MNPLVSLITPCYNGSGKIQLYLDSILNQTYNNLEIILINDGSTDDTEKIILSYRNKLIDKGCKFIYIKQKNQGLARTINNGLKIFSGEYLMWPDCDDILDKDNIKEKVHYLEKNKEIGTVYCNTKIVYSNNLNKVINFFNRELDVNRLDLFKDFIMQRNLVNAPGAWMIRSKFFLKIRNNRSIETNGPGQTYQMLLPMVYNYPVGKINKYLFTYIIYQDSDSHKNRTYEETLKYFCGIKKDLIEILNKIDMDKKNKIYYLELVDFITLSRIFNCDINFGKKKNAKERYLLLKNMNKISFRDRIRYILFKFNILKYIRFLKEFKRKFNCFN